MTGVDHAGSLFRAEAFQNDRDSECITVFRTEWGHEATMKQLVKLTKKYDWPIHIVHPTAIEGDLLA
jgi:hypothetical protein